MFNAIKRILYYAKPYIRYFILSVIFSLAGVITSLFVPILIGKAVDVIVGVNNVYFSRLAQIAGLLAACIIVSGLFQWLSGLCTNNLSYNTIKDIRTDLFNKLNNVPIKYIDASSKGELISRTVNDIDIISDGLLQGFSQLFTGIITIAVTLIFMLTINVNITIIVVLLTPLSLFAAAKITKLSHSSFMKQSELRGQLGGIADEFISNQKVVKAFVYEERAYKKFENINEQMSKNGIKATFFSSMTNPVTRFVNGIIYAAVGTAGALSAIGSIGFLGSITIGQLSSFLSFSNQYTKPFNEISGVIAEFQNAAASAERIFSVIDEPSEPSDNNAVSLSHCNGNVEFNNVCFSYTPKRKLIQNFTLAVQPGQKVAIVGPTGCGKTTVINLLLRFYDINSGELKISGHNIYDLTRDSLRKQFGMVLQDTWLFSGTVAENIAYGKPNASIEEIVKAAKEVHAHDFIKKLPQGYNTFLGENEGSISQGQKQLLSIARIMLTNPPVLILDEATSNIDIRTEQYIQKAFEKIMQGKTSFIIAHRLSTIKNADIILVMKDGNIIEKGKHDDLLLNKGFYYNLYSSQFKTV